MTVTSTETTSDKRKGRMVEDARPDGRYVPNQMHRVVKTAERHLIDAEAPIYQRGGQLVHVVRINKVEKRDAEGNLPPDSDGVVRRSGALVVRPMTPHNLLLHSTASTSWRRFDGRTKAWQLFGPPLELAHFILGRGEWGFRVMAGIIEAPTLRRDGSILAEEGYDEGTGYYLDFGGATFPSVPDEPTKAQAGAALALLHEVVADFPFVPDQPGTAASTARSVALSALLLALVRRQMDKAPIHAFDATAKGTGKTLLCNVIAAVATGRGATVMSFGATEEEFAKRLYAVLLTNDPLVVIDNVSRPIESEEFNAVTTNPKWKARVLGQSSAPEVDTNAAFLVNGNSLKFVGDLTVRTVMSLLDAGMERPEQRTGFAHPGLMEWVGENRGRIVAAALTVIRAHIVAGHPGLAGLVPSRFEQWDRNVRAALVWLGEPDPWNTSAVVVGMDTEREQLAALMEAWANLVGFDTRVSTHRLIDLAEMDDVEGGDVPGWTLEASNALDRALADCLRSVNHKQLYAYLFRFKGRVVGDRKVRMLPGPRGAVFWLERVEPEPPPPAWAAVELDYDGY